MQVSSEETTWQISKVSCILVTTSIESKTGFVSSLTVFKAFITLDYRVNLISRRLRSSKYLSSLARLEGMSL